MSSTIDTLFGEWASAKSDAKSIQQTLTTKRKAMVEMERKICAAMQDGGFDEYTFGDTTFKRIKRIEKVTSSSKGDTDANDA
jgi:hypothetical protein